MKGYSRYFWAIHFAGDLFLINIVFVLTYYIKFETFLFSDKYKFLLLIFNFLWTLTAFLLRLYDIKHIKRLDRVLFNLSKAALINGVALSGILFSLKASTFSREHLYATYAFSFGAVLIWRILALRLIYSFRKSGFNYKRVILIGGGKVAKQIYNSKSIPLSKSRRLYELYKLLQYKLDRQLVQIGIPFRELPLAFTA